MTYQAPVSEMDAEVADFKPLTAEEAQKYFGTSQDLIKERLDALGIVRPAGCEVLITGLLAASRASAILRANVSVSFRRFLKPGRAVPPRTCHWACFHFFAWA